MLWHEIQGGTQYKIIGNGQEKDSMVDLAETIINPCYANMKEDNDTKELHRPPCIRTSQPSYSPPPASSPAPVHSVHGLDIVLHLGAIAVVPPSVVPNMVSKIRGIGRQLFVERMTVPGPPGPWPRFCCLTWVAHEDGPSTRWLGGCCQPTRVQVPAWTCGAHGVSPIKNANEG